jgi:outer membrane protein OmpA-like peptidoglycan-associated protein
MAKHAVVTAWCLLIIISAAAKEPVSSGMGQRRFILYTLPGKKVPLTILTVKERDRYLVDIVAEKKKTAASTVVDRYQRDLALSLGRDRNRRTMVIDGKLRGTFSPKAFSYIGISREGELKLFEKKRFRNLSELQSFVKEQRLRHLFPTGQYLIYDGREIEDLYKTGVGLYLADVEMPRVVLGVKADNAFDIIVFGRKSGYGRGVTLREAVYICKQLRYRYAFALYHGNSGAVAYRREQRTIDGQTDFTKAYMFAREPRDDHSPYRYNLLHKHRFFLTLQKTVQVVRQGPDIVIRQRRVLFSLDSSRLSSTARDHLKGVVTIIKRYPDRDVAVHGFTDNQGEKAYNKRLSQQRAKAVAGFLAQNGIESSRLTVRGFGESKFIATNRTAAGRRLNRRVEIILTK